MIYTSHNTGEQQNDIFSYKTIIYLTYNNYYKQYALANSTILLFTLKDTILPNLLIYIYLI